MHWKNLAFVLLARGAVAQQMMRFSCSQLVISRMDPLVNPGLQQSPHVHQIVGGNSFNVSMDPENHDLVKDSSCTSCTFSEDFSNYWTAVLYFRARNGSFTRVRQFPNVGLRADGGVTVYYIPPYDGKTPVTAFKPGFRMLVGDPGLGAEQGSQQQRQLCHRCLGAEYNQGGAPCTGTDTKALPKGFCHGGIRTTITFPTCWDGKNIDSPDHRSHVSYPATGTFESVGNCPATHPVRLPQLMYEVMWDVSLVGYVYQQLLCSILRLTNPVRHISIRVSNTFRFLYRPARSMTSLYGQRMECNHSSGALATRKSSPLTYRRERNHIILDLADVARL
jgi:hypothetical protein